ncbi:MAG: FtsX-like permease family protein [Planctomycetota bacterium]
MRVRHLIAQEMRHRPLNVLPAAAAVAVAAGALVASVMVLALFDRQTEALLAAKERAVEEQMKEMEDEFRKITKRMGFNVLILPKDQELGDFYAENYAEKTMPEEYAERLANARDVVTIRHLLPMLQRKVVWPERKRRVLLIGVRGEMPWAHRSSMKPLLEPVPPGSAVLGWELHRALGLRKDDALTFMGREFRVHALHPERGSVDDITLWVNLQEAQALLGLEGRINSMMALECKCAWADLPKVRKEIQGVLPDTQVVELAGKALARAEARREAERNARALVAREKEHRAALRAERQGLVALLVPAAVAVAVVLVGVLTYLNVRERRSEIGVLRALGLRTSQILAAFLGKACIIGIAGSMLGVGAAVLAGPWVAGAASVADAARAAGGVFVAGVVFATPLVTVLAAWLPALAAAREDPAAVLREE